MFVDNNAEQKSTKDEKAPIKKKYTSSTIRLTLSLKEPDEESCSVFNYNKLVADEVSNINNFEIHICIRNLSVSCIREVGKW